MIKTARKKLLSSRIRRFLLINLPALLIAISAILCARRLSIDDHFEENFRFNTKADLLGSPEYFAIRDFKRIKDKDGKPVLAIKPGGQGLIGYHLSYVPGSSLQATVAVNDSEVSTDLIIQHENASGKMETDRIDLDSRYEDEGYGTYQLDLSSYLQEGHYIFVTLHSRAMVENTDEAKATGLLPAIAGVSFQFQRDRAHPMSVLNAAFFGLLCFLCWRLVIGFMLPLAWGAIRFPKSASPFRKALAWILAGLLVLAGIALLAHSLWYAPKLHDDRWALSNSRLLALEGFDTQDIFFRSRVRPGFMAFMLPLQSCLSHQVETVSYTHSDGKQRLFYVFDRTAKPFGPRVYPEATALAFFLLLTSCLLVARIAFTLDSGPGALPRGLITAGFALLLWYRILGSTMVSPISLSITWSFQVVAMLLFVRAWKRGKSWKPWIEAALATGIAILFKESAISFVLPLLLFQLLSLFLWNKKKILISRYACFWTIAAILPLLYYALILDGGFAEISQNLRQHVGSQEILEGYLQTTPSGIFRGLFITFHIGIILATLGVLFAILQKRVQSPSHIFFLLWFIGAATVFLLPFFYPRFLIYMIPTIAWFGAHASTTGIQAFHKKH